MGLSREDWQRALQMSGASPDTLAMVDRYPADQLPQETARRQPPQAPPEQPPAIPPETDRALEQLGSQYRVPADRAQQSAPGLRDELPANPYPEQLQQRPIDPRASSKQLRGDLQEAQIGAMEYGVEGKQIEGRAYDRQAQLAGELEQQRRQGLAETRARIDANRTEMQAFESKARARLDELNRMASEGPPEPDIMSTVLQVVGAMASQSRPAIGAGLQMLGRSMAGDTAGWQAEFQAKRGALASNLDMAGNERADSQNELAMQKSLVDLGFGVYDAALSKVKAEAGSESARNAADALQNEWRGKYVESQLLLRQQEAAAAQKRRGAAVEDMYYRMPVEELDAAMRRGELGRQGQEILAKRQKTDQAARAGEVGIASDLAKMRGGAGSEVAPGFVSTIQLGESVKAEVQKNAMHTADIVHDLGRLRAIRARNEDRGTWNADDMTEANSIIGSMSTKLSQLNGAGAPSEGERELFKQQLLDPTGFYARKNPIDVYDRAAAGFRAGFEAKLRSIGVVPAGSKSGDRLGFGPDKPGGQGGAVATGRGAQGGW